jgi:type I restriction enzyme S subunit
MISTLKPYPRMKDSGVQWLGEVPEHWEIRRGKALFNCIDMRSNTGDEELMTVSSNGGVIPRRTTTVTMFKAESYVGYKLCWPEDLVINSLWAWAGGLGISRHHGIVSSAYGVYRLRLGQNCLPGFIHELVRSTPFQWELQARSKGIWTSRLQLTDESFLGAPFPVPPHQEQSAIVSYLSYMDRRIGRYIRTKQKLIKLLNEQKQAIINKTVTRGLDPKVRLKSSGVDWLGEIPEHWEVRRLKTLISSVTSGSRGWSNFAADDGPLFIRIGNLTRASIGLDLSDAIRLNLPKAMVSETERTRVSVGDLLLSITAYIGSVAVVPENIGEAYVSQHVACCRLTLGAANIKWLAYFLLSPIGQTHGKLCMYGGTKQGLSLDDVKNYVVLLPPGVEQNALASLIEDMTKNIDEALQSVHHQISLLREYRTRLIADVITGKLDVREAVTHLPDEAEEPEPIDDADVENNGNEDLEMVEEIGETG